MKKPKYFIITVDTEGDNLWKYEEGNIVETNNAEYIPRFQLLCEQYCFKPVYLTNYEMAKSDIFVDESKKWLANGNCEIGVHLHAWNNPPYYDLVGPFNGNPYLIEYPEEIMRAKFKVIYDLIVERFQVKPISHRAGRWAVNEKYIKILNDFDIKVDCSYTPGINWSKNKGKILGGSDYSKIDLYPFRIGNLYEMPVSIINTNFSQKKSFKHRIKVFFKGENIWLRPATSNVQEMKYLIRKLSKIENLNYIEFMIHSSELMPNGSPYFKDKYDIEREYESMKEIFEYVSKLGYIGCTFKEYIKNLH